MTDLRSDHAPMRVRCPNDDGTSAHYAFDIQLPVRFDAKGPIGALAKISPCGCKHHLVVLGEGDEEPMVTNARKRAEATSG